MKEVFPASESAAKINFIPSQATKTEEQFYFIVQGLRSTYNYAETLKSTIPDEESARKKTYQNIIIDYNDTLIPVVIKQYFPLSFFKLIEFWHFCDADILKTGIPTNPKNIFQSIQKEWEICFLQIQANLIFNSSFNFSSTKLPSLHGKFIIEVIQQRDVKHFVKLLPHYVEHMLASSPSFCAPSSSSSPLPSLLCKIIGLFKFKFSMFNSVYFIVYLNPEFVHENYSFDILNRYYLRGAKLNRSKNYRHLSDAPSLPDSYSLFFDTNLDRSFYFPKSNYELLMNVLIRDVHFLKKRGMTGYFLAIFDGHFSDKSTSDEFASSNNLFHFAHDVTTAVNNQSWILLGGIQCIWKFYGKTEHVNYLRKLTKKATDITVVEPAMYSERFLKMVEAVVKSHK